MGNSKSKKEEEIDIFLEGKISPNPIKEEYENMEEIPLEEGNIPAEMRTISRPSPIGSTLVVIILSMIIIVLFMASVGVIIWFIFVLIAFHYASKYERKRIIYTGNYSIMQLFIHTIIGPIYFIL